MAVADLTKVLWLRAKDLGATGSTVTAWQDQARSAVPQIVAGSARLTVAATEATPNGGKCVAMTTAPTDYLVYPDLFNTAADFGAVFASHEIRDTQNGAWDERSHRVIDGNVDTNWLGNTLPAWVAVGLKTAKVVTEYTIRARSGGTVVDLDRTPRDWQFQGSQDAQSWTTLDTRAGQAFAAGEARTFTATNSTAYRYYRVYVTAVKSGAAVNIAELSLTGCSLSYVPATSGELWAVVRSTNTATNGAPWGMGLDSQQSHYTYGGSWYDDFGNDYRQHVTPGVDVTQWRVVRVKSDGTFQAWVDNVSRFTTGTAANFPTHAVIGANNAALHGHAIAGFAGFVAEIIVRPTVSTTVEAQEIYDYLRAEHFDAVAPGGSTVGAVAAVAQASSVAVVGTVTGGTVTGSVAASAPAPVVAVDGAVTGGPVSGEVAAVAPSAQVAVAGSIPSPATRLEPWTADLSRRTRLVLRTGGSVDALPPLELPPAGFVERPIMRKSVTVPALTTLGDVAGGRAVTAPDYDALEDAATVEEVGVPHIVFPNWSGLNDITYYRDGITRILRDRREEPFGDVSMVLELPQVTSMDVEADSPTNDSPMNWTRNRANAEIVLRKSDGTITRGVWTGHVVSHDTGNDAASTTKTLTCQGTMWQAATDVHKVPNMLDPTDVGTLIPKSLNTVASRRYPRLPNVSTGILSKQRGSWSDSPMAYAQGLLATAHTEAGHQWTVAKVEGTRRTYEMRLKKTTPEWTVTNGARGVDVALVRDATVVRNVVYGHGVGPDGYAWWNYHYPNLRMDDAPAYPYSSASTVMSVGSTDAGTTSGEGVSDWQRRARDLGYNVTVNGVFSSDDATAAGAIQRRYGLQVDNVVGPQTWAATFDVGGNGGDLTGAIRLPLAADPRTQRFLYNADGSVAGDNPDYDPNVIIYAADVDFGAGVTREEGIRSAQQIVDRESEPGLTGRITLRTDPREGSRILIPPGDKLTLVGFEGADRVLHITAVERDWVNLTVTLEVDEKSRDAMTLAQIRERNREARRDPARRPGNVNRRSRLDVDSVVPFDGESGAGWIPRHALYGGLWTVIRVPVSELGRVAKIDLRTTGPASKFAVALFGAPITPAHLVKYVGNPLASDSPYEANAELLEDRFGFIEGWGQSGQAAGYWPRSEGDGSLTGRLVDAGGFEYVSARPPWVWVAEYAATSTFIQGRILPAPIQ